jgi:diaminohydroxyphosphoribosylaminopyrimidine deaminase / 5-amino-6-(5-phosphoribosylamino)uracil reductase
MRRRRMRWPNHPVREHAARECTRMSLPPLSAADDVAMMRLALAMARRGLGRSWPNPAVGAVVWMPTAEGPRVIARALTEAGGRPHAETEALRLAGPAARGAVMSVTLEPCSHHGKTPPCAEALVKAGLSRVVLALEDPDPRVAGRGHALLRQAGLEVVVGVEARAAFLSHIGHIRRVTRHRPAVLLKLARTQDGYAAGDAGTRLQITGPIGSARVHIERAEADAIMVGIGTVLADDPQLTCRLSGLQARSPIRVVLDTQARLPLTSMLVKTARLVPVWVIVGEGADPARVAALVAHGVEVITVPQTYSDDAMHLDLEQALQALGQRGITRVMSEGGPHVADALARAGLVDEVTLITHQAPLGRQGLRAVGPHLQQLITDKTQFEALPHARYGEDVIEHFARVD